MTSIVDSSAKCKQKIEEARRESLQRFLRDYEPPPIDATPGKASDYMVHFLDTVKKYPNKPLNNYCRESHSNQDARGSLNEQESNLIKELAKYNKAPLKTFKKVESGWRLENTWDRMCLIQAANHAREKDAILVAEGPSRFIRSFYYSKHRQDIKPSVFEYEQLREITEGVTLATILHPDTSWKEERSYQTKRGIREKNLNRVRPFKDISAEERKACVLWMKGLTKMGSRMIAKEVEEKLRIKISHTSVCDVLSEKR